jgi:four helix bundle protein
MNAEGGTRNAEHQGKVVPRDLKSRTKAFAIEIIRLVESLPRGRSAEILGRQLLRSGTSVAANYRAARRARSRKEFLAKLGIVEEEADESCFWLELLADAGLSRSADIERLRNEADQLVAITISSIRTARGPHSAVPRSAFRVPR